VQAACREVCEIPFSHPEPLFTEITGLLRRLLSQEIIRDRSVMMLLANMCADQRFAVFLTNLSARYRERGYSPTTFQLRISRQDIANSLELAIESISRLIARFKQRGLLKVSNGDVELLDLQRFQALALEAPRYH
jgi:CRP/FNR family transcriptional regulator